MKTYQIVFTLIALALICAGAMIAAMPEKHSIVLTEKQLIPTEDYNIHLQNDMLYIIQNGRIVDSVVYDENQTGIGNIIWEDCHE